MSQSGHEASNSQDRIWEHFQNEASASFAAAAPRMKFLVNWMKRNFKADRQPSVLNIGVGNGLLEKLALERGFRVASLDPDAKSIGRLQAQGVNAKTGYIESIPFENHEFDFVIASEVFEHLSDASRLAGAREIARILQPAGSLLVTVPYNEDLALSEVICPDCGKIFHRWGHQKSFTAESLRSELQPHFQQVDVSRTVFVDFTGGIGRRVKSIARLVLARFGQMIAVPSLFAICHAPVSQSSNQSVEGSSARR